MALRPGMNMVQRGTSTTADDASKQWSQLREAIDQIYHRNTASYSFQHLYQIGYQLVQHSHGDFLYKKISDAIHDRLEEQAKEVHVAMSNAGSDHSFLSVLLKQWESHTQTTTRTARLLIALDRFAYNNKLPQIVKMGNDIFGKTLILRSPFHERLTSSFLSVIEKDRLGEEAPDFMLLKSASSMAAEVDRQGIFVPLIEQPYLQRTQTFYENEAKRRLSHMTTPQYIYAFFDRLQGEHRRATTCVDEATAPKAEAILAMAYLTAHKTTLLTKEGSGCHDLLKSNRIEDLAMLFKAFSIVNDSASVTSYVCSYFKQEGDSVTSNKEITGNAALFVEKLMNIRQQMDHLLKEALVLHSPCSSNLGGGNPDDNDATTFAPAAPKHRDRTAELAISRVFAEIVNKNHMCPEYLSQFLDAKMRSNCEDRDIEIACEQTLQIFAHLAEKDQFESAYKLHLARRLLQGKAVNEDQERIFVSMLKKEVGSGIASKIEGMFNDRRTSADIMDTFRRRLEQRTERLPHEINVTVLTSGFWPQAVNVILKLPPETERCANVFRMFYLARNKGRRLDYLLTQGSADFRLNHGGKRYDLNVPTQCMPILLMFQTNEQITVGDVAEVCGMGVPETAKAVVTLARNTTLHAGVLKIESASPGASAGTAVTRDSKVRFNDQFKSRQLKIKIAALVASKDKDGRADSAATRSSGLSMEQLEEDRKYKIDAAVVRIMKSRRTLAHKDLVTEVVNVLKLSFAPSSEQIKRRIEHLIEREFLERHPEMRGTYNYLAS